MRTYLPWFALQSEADAARVTVRDLVTHHAGYVGDYFKDTGRGERRFRGDCPEDGELAAAGAAGYTFSYSNAGFYVLGHIVETLRGRPFEAVIRERIFEPLGMDRSFYFPEECITHRVAAGHIVTADGPKVARPWNTPRSIAPGGGITSNVIDQVRYAALHVGETPAHDVLRPGSIAFMRQAQRPAGSMCESIGVSWMLDDAGGGHRLVKHGGATNGHLSAFELIPEAGFGVTVLTNSDTGREARQTIADRCQEQFPRVREASARRRDRPAGRSGRIRRGCTSGAGALEVQADGAGLVVADTTPERGFAEARHRPIPLPPAHLAFTGRDTTAVLDGPRRASARSSSGALAAPSNGCVDGRIARRLAE